MLRLTYVISSQKLIQSTIMRPGFLRLEIIMSKLQDSFSTFGAKLWNSIPNKFCQLSKGAFKQKFHDFLLSIMEAEDDYFKVPILLEKMTNSLLWILTELIINRFC